MCCLSAPGWACNSGPIVHSVAELPKFGLTVGASNLVEKPHHDLELGSQRRSAPASSYQFVGGNHVPTGKFDIRRRCFQRLQQAPEEAFRETDLAGKAAAADPKLDNLVNSEGAIDIVELVPVLAKIRDQRTDQESIRERRKRAFWGAVKFFENG